MRSDESGDVAFYRTQVEGGRSGKQSEGGRERGGTQKYLYQISEEVR